MENSKPLIAKKFGCGHWRELLKLQSFDKENFGAFDRWLLVGGGSLREVVPRGGKNCTKIPVYLHLKKWTLV